MIDASESPRRLLFRAHLKPHRSLSRRAFRRIMLGVTLFSVTVSLVSFLAGAWPIFGFMGIDILLVWFALRLSYRRALVSEVVELDEQFLTIERTDPKGRSRLWRLQPAWLRVGAGGTDPTPDAGDAALPRRGVADRRIPASGPAPRGCSRPARRPRAMASAGSAIWISLPD